MNIIQSQAILCWCDVRILRLNPLQQRDFISQNHKFTKCENWNY
jgi:hypothetical protein